MPVGRRMTERLGVISRARDWIVRNISTQTLLKIASAPTVLGLALLSSTAFAQEPQAADEAEVGEAIIVTGSRISRPELEVANPIVALTAEAIERTGQTNITDILVRNPALSASLGSSRAGGADAAFGQTGANLLDLRNLGTDRTLVLVNGKRHVAGLPNSAAVDINSIPQDLVERVDVLTGGASAVYGADGVSGVVNFIMKRNFEGLTARFQTGVSSKGDAGSQFGSIVAGKNFADDRGNIAVAYEYSGSDRVGSKQRRFTGDPSVYSEILRNQNDFPDDPNVFDRIRYTNLTWADSAIDGAVDVDLDGIPDFTGSGLPYDRGLPLSGGNSRAVGGSNTPLAGYFGDLQPETSRHAVNLLTSFEFSPALRFYAEGKYVKSKAYSVGQPSFDFFTYLQPDNAYLLDQFGPGTAPDGALVSRDNFEFGLRGETVERETVRFVAGFEGDLTDNLHYDVSYIFGRTSASNSQTSNLLGDRYYAAIDAVRNPLTNQIVCRSTLDPTSNINPDNYDAPATTFTPGANSPCRPLNIMGNGVASQEALNFVLANNRSTSRVSQEVISGYVSGDFGAVFTLPGGPIGFALGGEYRRETSISVPDEALQNGDFRDFAAVAPSSGSFNVKEFFAELNAPILSNMPFAERLTFGAALRFSDYSTIGKTTTWKVDGVYAPIRDIRFRATYSEAVRAPNIGELFRPASGTFDFVRDPCDITRLNDGTSTRTANCTAILSGLGLTPTQIANFSPNTDSQATTSRRGLFSGNADLQEETARTWTAGVVLQPRFIPGLTLTFDWYDIKISDAINTPTPTELADLCVDQPTIDNIYCQNIFRDPATGFVLGDGNDTQRRNGFIVRPENVAGFRTAGADFTLNYRFSPSASLGDFRFSLTGGYLDKISFVPTIGAETDDDILEQYNPRWRGSIDLAWTLDKVTASYALSYWSKTRRYTTEQLAANPDLSDPKYFYYKERFEHDVRVAVEVGDRFQVYAGVNNLFDYKPDIGMLSYPVSGIGRYLYAGAKITLGPIF